MDDVSPTTIGFEKASRLLEDLAPAHILTMRTISEWVKEEKTPISQAEVIKRTVNKHDIAAASVISALKVLLKKGYIRRAVITSNKTYYVQLRSLR